MAPQHSIGVDEKRWKWSLVDAHDLVGVGECTFDVAPVEAPLPDEVRASVLVEDRRVRVARMPTVDVTAERLVLDLDQIGGVAGQLARGGYDSHHRLAHVARPPDRHAVVHDLVRGRELQLEVGIGEFRDLLAGQRAVDAAQLDRLGDVDPPDQSVRVRRAHEVHVAGAIAPRSSKKTPCPWTSRLSSLRGTLCPTERRFPPTRSGALVVIAGLLSVAGGPDRLEDVLVARAAADVALDGVENLVIGGMGIVLEQRGRTHQHPGCAVAALERVVGDEGALQHREPVVVGEPLDGPDPGPVGLGRKDQGRTSARTRRG